MNPSGEFQHTEQTAGNTTKRRKEAATTARDSPPRPMGTDGERECRRVTAGTRRLPSWRGVVSSNAFRASRRLQAGSSALRPWQRPGRSGESLCFSILDSGSSMLLCCVVQLARDRAMKHQRSKHNQLVLEHLFSGARPSSGAASSTCSNASDFSRHASCFGRRCARGRTRSAKHIRS